MSVDGRFATAVHVLAVLAYKDGEHVSSQFISVSVNTHPVIIRRILPALQAAGLVETRKGPKAGSRLSRSAGRITLAEVYHALKCSEPFCMPRKAPNLQCPVGRRIRIALKPVFVSARHALEQDLARTTLAGVMAVVKGSPRLR